MVAQTKVDIRSAAAKTAAADKQSPQDEVVVDNKDLLQDQAAAAAVVDAGQSDAVAVQVTAEAGILPTDAPLQSIGEIAQAPAPTTTDTTTPATTPAPAAETGAATALSPWAIGGIALVGIGAVAAAANSGDDNPPAAEPPPGPVPPPVNNLPTSVDSEVVLSGTDTPLSAANFQFVDADATDTLASVTIASINPVFDAGVMGDAFRFDEASGKGYELVTGAGTWEAAKEAAEAKGGYLAVLDSEAEMTLINTLYDGLGAPDGNDGTWVGASQSVSTGLPGDGWTWVNGAPLDGVSTVWNNTGAPDNIQLPYDEDGTENGQAQYGAIFDGDTPNTDFALLYDRGTVATDLPKYLIEYDLAATPLTLDGAAVAAGQTIAQADLAKLSWDSMFNEGGSITYNVTDSQGGTSAAANTLTFTNPVTFDGGASQSISTLIEDQHLTGLA